MVAIGGPPSVLDEILAFNADRKPKRVRVKIKRMKANPFAFFRGTDHLFARAWPDLKVPDVGPSLLICGDLHLENFGAYRADDGAFYYDINDFDEALVGPVSLDLVRCATSILLAAELWKLTPLEATGMVLVFLDRYRAAFSATPSRPGLDPSVPHEGRGPIWDLLGATALGTQKALLDLMTESGKGGVRRIVRAKGRRPAIGAERAGVIARAVEEYGKGTASPGSYKVLDVTARVAGIGSVGLRRYVVLIEGEGAPDANRLLDIKEARASSLLGCTHAPQPDWGGDEARRSVEAQRTLQARPTVGLDVIAIEGQSFRMRELVPDENRSSLDRLDGEPDDLRQAIAAAGQLTAWSHLRGASTGDGAVADVLRRWAEGPALDSVLVAAARYAERTRLDHAQFLKELAARGTPSR